MAPYFEGEDQFGHEVSLADFRDLWLVVYFYPKDDTPGCTKEACGFRDEYAELKKVARVVGVSADSVASHHRFAQKHELPFSLIADPEKKMIKSYEAWGAKKFMGKEYQGILRISYLINPEGKIARVYDKVNTAKHAQQVIGDIKSFQR